MPLTFLDDLTVGARDKCCAGAAHLMRTDPALARVLLAGTTPPKSDFEAARLSVLAHLRCTELGLLSRLYPRHEEESADAAVYYMAVAPFYCRASDPPGSVFTRNCTGVRLSRGLVEDLSHAKPPKDSDAHVVPELRRQHWYVDLPERAVWVGEGEQLRAILTGYLKDGAVLVHAMVSRPGAKRLLRTLSWVLGERTLRAGMTTARAKGGIDLNYLQESVEDLLHLAILYKQTAGSGEVQRLPRAPTAAAACHSRRMQKLLKRFSLFDVVHLDGPPGGFGRQRAGGLHGGGGWHLDRRQTVTAHFKMQRCGPGGQQRKLIRVNAYERGPLDGRLPSKLVVLPRGAAA